MAQLCFAQGEDVSGTGLFTEDINFTYDSLLVWIVASQSGEVVDRIVCIGWRDIH